MACVANLQYGWTLFVNPIDVKYHWGRASIQVAFSIFVLIETWFIPEVSPQIILVAPTLVTTSAAERRRHATDR